MTHWEVQAKKLRGPTALYVHGRSRLSHGRTDDLPPPLFEEADDGSVAALAGLLQLIPQGGRARTVVVLWRSIREDEAVWGIVPSAKRLLLTSQGPR
ncbi:hypothetical protein ANO14919_106620 [Xylariales sp. No.14919]|nr:hypothetical protein ANO14919_106620 [Xylariales sp. No.14919]